MDKLIYGDLYKDYGGFTDPRSIIEINGKDISKNPIVINNIDVEISAGFEASIATFEIYNVFDRVQARFEYESLSKAVVIGASLKIYLGYASLVKEVFTGVITKVTFAYEAGEAPHITVTGMDIKGVMMAGSYSKQLKAKTYSAAVKEILEKTAYSKMKSSGIIEKLYITNTPDTPPPGTPNNNPNIEMVAESDYEFVVKAAKKFNYEFFTVGGNVYFRPAKCDPSEEINISATKGLFNCEVEYDITGLAETIEARGMDDGKGKVISAKDKIKNKISLGSKAAGLIKGSEKIYIDPTIKSDSDATNRVKSLKESISFRFGTFRGTTIGIPNLIPGAFINLEDLGAPVTNKFYIYSIHHKLNQTDGYLTDIVGQAACIP
ncbi:phage late control D family protein [Pseudobutyrivibrio sp. MD2005]|uniref:phage late control D family protein n=1 Tax=Pseudobutyrivibrio sp. MD2005 TaxID=1410616 RepID=UPI00048756E1|nr:hypothetical protein [Pseudobutyrivibrio sp. MD2005]